MTVFCTTDGDRVLVRFQYNARLVTAVKRVPGARWRPDDKTWTAPLTLDTCRVLRRVFGRELEVLPALSRWARDEMQRELLLENLRIGADGSTAQLKRTAELAPQLAMAIDARRYQAVGARWLATAETALLGDQPGLGKTLQTLAALVESGARNILVLCPKTAIRTVWVEETNRWAPTIMPFAAQGSRAERKQVMTVFREMPYDRPKMLIGNTEMMRAKRWWVCPDGKERDKPPNRKSGCQADHPHKVRIEYVWPYLFEQKWDAIVLDESHNSLATTRNTMSKDISQVRLGAMHLRKRLVPGGLAIALSGTPARSKLPRFWGTLNWLRPDVFTSFWNFAKTHFDVEQGNGGYGTEVSADPVDPEAFSAALRPYYLARTKADVAPDLPPITYAGTPPLDNPEGANGIWLDMEGQQAEAYQQMKRMATVKLDGGTITANGVLAEITRARQFASAYQSNLDGGDELRPVLPSNKLDWVLEFLREREGFDGKVVIASAFTKLVKMFALELEAAGYPVMTLTGETSDKGRQELVRRFADPEDKARVAIINTYAGGEAITLDAADDMIFLDLPWTSDQAEQVESRIHRVSRVHQVTVYRLLSRGTIDEWLASTTDEQRQRMLSAKPQEIREVL